MFTKNIARLFFENLHGKVPARTGTVFGECYHDRCLLEKLRVKLLSIFTLICLSCEPGYF